MNFEFAPLWKCWHNNPFARICHLSVCLIEVGVVFPDKYKLSLFLPPRCQVSALVITVMGQGMQLCNKCVTLRKDKLRCSQSPSRTPMQCSRPSQYSDLGPRISLAKDSPQLTRRIQINVDLQQLPRGIVERLHCLAVVSQNITKQTQSQSASRSQGTSARDRKGKQ